MSEIPVGFGQALNPTVDKLLAPWTSLDGSWSQPAGPSRHDNCDAEEINPGNLFLSPAPGEEFDLTIQVADQLLNFISSNIYIQVLCGDVYHQYFNIIYVSYDSSYSCAVHYVMRLIIMIYCITINKMIVT